jgi:hypothetical protein
MKGRVRWGLLVIAALVAVSCSKSDPNRKETFPVTGELYVDGQPAPLVQISMHDKAGADTNQPTFSSTLSDQDGKFALSTYEEGDGAPPGDYVLTFTWQEFNVLSRGYSGPDKLNGKYSDPKKTPFEVKVEKGKPTDLGRIELKTK